MSTEQPAISEITPPAPSFFQRRRDALRAWFHQRRFYFWLGGFLLTLTFVLLVRVMFFTIPAGHAGVIFNRFQGGTDTNYVRDEGLQFIFPWNYPSIYDVRLQQISHTFDIISRDGLSVEVTLSIRYRPRIELLGVLHREVGHDYVNIIVIPEVQALARSTFGAYTPEEMYTTKRTLIEETLSRAVGQVSERYVVLDDLLVKGIKLPGQLKAAIEHKLIDQQNSLAMQYRISREKQEADRKLIEAKGTANYNSTINPTLSEDLLRYRGIEATLQLAQSPNAKLVIIGNRNGLPLILDPSKVGQDSSADPVQLQTTPPATASLTVPVNASANEAPLTDSKSKLITP